MSLIFIGGLIAITIYEINLSLTNKQTNKSNES